MLTPNSNRWRCHHWWLRSYPAGYDLSSGRQGIVRECGGGCGGHEDWQGWRYKPLLDDHKTGLLQVDMKKIKSAAPLMGNSYLCPVATSHLSVEIQGIDNGSEKSYKISQYKGRWVIIIWFILSTFKHYFGSNKRINAIMQEDTSAHCMVSFNSCSDIAKK